LGPHGALLVLLTLRFALGLGYAWLVPPWESYDETGHYQYARYIAKHGRLLQPGDPEAEVIWSRFQPPVYYLLVAPVLVGFDFTPTFTYPLRNPFFVGGRAGLNYAITTPDPAGQEAVEIAALRAGRMAGVLMATLSVIAVYAAGRRLWPYDRRAALGSAGVYAFWPQAVFIGSMMTNDLLMVVWAALMLWAVVHTWHEGLRLPNLLALAGIALLALLTKLNGLPLLLVAGLVVALRWLRPAGGGRPPAPMWSVFAVAVCVIGGFVLTQMEFVSDQILQIATLQRFMANLQTGMPIDPLLIFSYGWTTFVASFGWGNVETWPWAYALIDLVCLVGVAGGMWVAWRRPDRWSLGLLLATVLGSTVALTIMLTIAQSDPYLVVGRYWLPALPALAVVLAAGWRRWHPGLVATPVVATAVVSTASLFGVIVPTYALPQPLTGPRAQALLDVTSPALVPGITLVGDWTMPELTPDGTGDLTLCWVATQPVDAVYAVRLEVTAADGQGYGVVETLPGDGRYPPNLWAPGIPFCDTYRLHVRGDFPAPGLGQLVIQLTEPPRLSGPILEQTFAPSQAVGAAIRRPILVRAPEATLPSAATADPTVQTEVVFEDQMRLLGYDLRAEGAAGYRLRLFWMAKRGLPESYTVFAHLRDTPLTAFSQSDQVPRQGSYPTSLWRPGEIVIDDHWLPLPETPPGPLQLVVGVYTPDRRVFVSVEGGAPQAEVVLQTVP
jgi:hypothetical protein